MKEILFTSLMFIALLFLPFWVMALLSFVGIVYLRAYGVVVGLAFLYDVLYFSGEWSVVAPTTATVPLAVYALIASLIMLMVRSRLRDDS